MVLSRPVPKFRYRDEYHGRAPIEAFSQEQTAPRSRQSAALKAKDGMEDSKQAHGTGSFVPATWQCAHWESA